ncbi:MAG: hypothetical protein ACRDBG_19440 [Waterburya sp.]
METTRLYQYGRFVFPGVGFTCKRELGIKNLLEDSAFINGRVRVNKFNQDFTESTFYKVTFTNTEYTKNQLDEVFYNKPQKVFFVEKFYNNDTEGDYRVYFAYASVYSISEVDFDCTENPKDYEVTLRLMDRRYLIEDNRLKFIKFDDLLKAQQGWEFSGGQGWEASDGSGWEDPYGGFSKSFNQLTPRERNELIDCCDTKGFFDYQDLYFAQEVRRIDATAKNFIEVNLTASDGTATPFTTLTRIGGNQLNLYSTSETVSSIFEIEKDGTLPALGVGEWIEILNNSTQSGFKVTCLNAFAPAVLSVFSHKSIKLYNANDNQPLNFLDPMNAQIFQKWKIESIGDNVNFFEFTSEYPLYKHFGVQEVETLLIRRNFSGNLKIRIVNLPTFY